MVPCAALAAVNYFLALSTDSSCGHRKLRSGKPEVKITSKIELQKPQKIAFI